MGRTRAEVKADIKARNKRIVIFFTKIEMTISQIALREGCSRQLVREVLAEAGVQYQYAWRKEKRWIDPAY